MNKTNKILIYKTILKPIWAYGIQLWGSAAESNIEIIQRFQNKVLGAIADAPGWVTNSTILNDIEIPSVRDEIRHHTHTYLNKLTHHPNEYAQDIISTLLPTRLKKHRPIDLYHSASRDHTKPFLSFYLFILFLIYF